MPSVGRLNVEYISYSVFSIWSIKIIKRPETVLCYCRKSIHWFYNKSSRERGYYLLENLANSRLTQFLLSSGLYLVFILQLLLSKQDESWDETDLFSAKSPAYFLHVHLADFFQYQTGIKDGGRPEATILYSITLPRWLLLSYTWKYFTRVFRWQRSNWLKIHCFTNLPWWFWT